MFVSKDTSDVDIPDNFTIEYLELSDGVKLRHFYFRPENPEGIVMLYPGMNTLVLSWIKILELLSELNYRIEYVESREKTTSIMTKKHEISKARMNQDCAESIKKIGLDGKDYIIIGSSLGSMTLIHCLADKTINPPHVILVGPPLILKAKLLFRIIIFFINDTMYKYFFKPIVRFIIVRAYTNDDDPKQKRKYILAIELATIWKLKRTIKAWINNRVHDELPKIDGNVSKCYLIGASEDKLHVSEDTKYIADNIQNADFVDLKTNTAAHEQPLVDLIVEINKKIKK